MRATGQDVEEEGLHGKLPLYSCSFNFLQVYLLFQNKTLGGKIRTVKSGGKKVTVSFNGK